MSPDFLGYFLPFGTRSGGSLIQRESRRSRRSRRGQKTTESKGESEQSRDKSSIPCAAVLYGPGSKGNVLYKQGGADGQKGSGQLSLQTDGIHRGIE